MWSDGGGAVDTWRRWCRCATGLAAVVAAAGDGWAGSSEGSLGEPGMGCDAASPDSAMVPTRGCCRDAPAVGGVGAVVVTALVGLVAMVGARSLACSFSMCASSAACNASSPAPGSRSAVGLGYHVDAAAAVDVAVGRPVTGAATDVKADTGCCTRAPATNVDGPAVATAVDENLAVVGTGRAVTLAAAAPPCMVQVVYEKRSATV